MAWHPFIGPATAALLAGDPGPARQLISLGIATPDDFSRGAIIARWQDAHSLELGNLLQDLGPLLPIAEAFFPEITPVVAAATVAATGKVTPGQLLTIGGAMDFNPDFPWSGDTGNGGLEFPPVDIPTDPGFDVGGGFGDVNLGTIGDVIGDLAGGGSSGAGGMMPVASPAAAVGAGAGLALRGMSQIVAGAILKLKQALGGGGFLTAGGIASFGSRTWAALTSWAARNPGLSVISTLVGLGLTVEEAAHFLAWGSTRRRRRHRRGISYRDMRTTRRTMSRVISMSHQLRALCGAVPHRTYGHRHRVINVPARRR